MLATVLAVNWDLPTTDSVGNGAEGSSVVLYSLSSPVFAPFMSVTSSVALGVVCFVFFIPVGGHGKEYIGVRLYEIIRGSEPSKGCFKAALWDIEIGSVNIVIPKASEKPQVMCLLHL